MFICNTSVGMCVHISCLINVQSTTQQVGVRWLELVSSSVIGRDDIGQDVYNVFQKKIQSNIVNIYVKCLELYHCSQYHKLLTITTTN